jgi:riboflavin kinase/FMN adenylyltransferase
LKNGNVKQAQTYLGRSYSMVGKVIKGNNIGKRYNYPTANLEVIDPHKLVPANGVYAVDVIFENRTYKSMLNIGVKPTFGGDNHSIEAHIFNFDKNLYDKYLTVKFKERLRDERKFDSVEDLFKQLEIDKKKSLLI